MQWHNIIILKELDMLTAATSISIGYGISDFVVYLRVPLSVAQPYYYDPHYGWVATASPVDGRQMYPHNPAAFRFQE